MQGLWVFLDVSGKPKAEAGLTCKERGRREGNKERRMLREKEERFIIIATIH